MEVWRLGLTGSLGLSQHLLRAFHYQHDGALFTAVHALHLQTQTYKVNRNTDTTLYSQVEKYNQYFGTNIYCRVEPL